MERLIEINGCVEVHQDIDEDIFCDRFIEFIESNGWYFGGGIWSERRLIMESLIKIGGCVEVSQDIDEDIFCDSFIKFIESSGWHFGGGFRTIENDYYINKDGTRGAHVLDEE